MDSEIVRQLLDINRKFYSDFARAFSDTRSSGQSRLERIVAYIGASGKALDVGCGNGRLAERLERERHTLQYVGVDASSELIAIASAQKLRWHHVAAEFYVADLAALGWSAAFEPASFDVAVALAVLHHVPSFDLRCNVLREIHTLLKPGAQLIVTNWHFERNERLRKKIVAWDMVGLALHQLEEGDALMTWERGGRGYRYCHLVTQSEVKKLAEQSGFSVIEQFYADADLNLYSILAKT